MERKYLKIVGIVNIILGIFLILSFLGLFIGIPLLVNGIIFNNYSSLSDEELQSKKTYILIWSCILLLLNIITSILGFLAYDKLCYKSDKENIKIDKQTKN